MPWTAHCAAFLTWDTLCQRALAVRRRDLLLQSLYVGGVAGLMMEAMVLRLNPEVDVTYVTVLRAALTPAPVSTSSFAISP